MEISTTMVKELRTATGAGVLDCRKALENSEGDFDRAVELLREKGLSAAAKKASREANEGLIGNYVADGSQLAALVEVNCETDFVARTPDFQTLCQDLGRQIAEDGTNLATTEDLLAQPYADGSGRTVKDVLNEMIARLGENMKVRRFARLTVTGPAGLIGNYVHMGSKVASLVEVTCDHSAVVASPEFQGLVRDLAMQVVAARPGWLAPQEVPADVLAKEKEIYRAQLGETNKPPQIIERILDGKLGKFYEENCLLEQPFIKDDSKRIKELVAETGAKLGAQIAVRRFARLEVGG